MEEVVVPYFRVELLRCNLYPIGKLHSKPTSLRYDPIPIGTAEYNIMPALGKKKTSVIMLFCLG